MLFRSHHLIGAKQLAMMKPSATLVNIARGGIVDDAALIAALKSGQIAAAGIDVFENEPAFNPEFLALKNVVLTPHIGSASVSTRRAMAYLTADNLIAALTGLVFGLAPALQAARVSLTGALKEGGRGSGVAKNRLRNALVVAEIALSLVLLVGASLFVRSFLNLQSAKAGVDTDPLMLMRFYIPGDQYDPEDAIVRRVEDIVRRAQTVPGVASVMASNLVPMSGGGDFSAVVPEGVSFKAGEEPGATYFGEIGRAHV